GEDVSTIGNPLGELTFSMSRGIVSCLNREINLNGTPFNMIQIDTAINPGNSGGPLFNSYGEVVGIVTAKTSTADSRGTAAEGLGFAIPIDDVLSMLKDIMENGQVTSHAYMGVIMEDVSRHAETGVRSGAYLVEVTENGPAAKAGLQAGDVITMLGTSTITSSSDLKSAVGSKSYVAGDTATVTFVRDGQVMTTELTFGSTIDKPQEPTPQSTTGGNQQAPDSNSGYDEYYGDMEDFFNQFFGRYGRAS
ncbi:MAG: PDZ domain-containing protein, partial [Oscillospiraceae bacterium]|nr:PDZ domain-containing protein [Oscillospiraceae bacterium]MCI9562590.1 PDZ domain-containing protein [Oscillospiraceae bacterium]